MKPLLAVGGPLGPTGVTGHFTKAAKTYSDIDFILIFHISTRVKFILNIGSYGSKW